MKGKINYTEQVLQQAQRFQATNQYRLAYDVIAEHFSKRQRPWDSDYDKLVTLGFAMAFNLSIVPSVIVKSCAERLVDRLPEFLLNFLDDIDTHLKEEQLRAQQEVESCKSELLSSVDLPRLLHDSVVSPAYQYASDVYIDFLDKILGIPKYDETFHIIARRAFNFCKTYNLPDSYNEICTRLPSGKSTSDMSPSAISRCVETHLIRYQTALDLHLLEAALMAIDDAYNVSILSPLSSDVKRDIEEKKLEILLLTNRRHFSAIQRHNLMSETGFSVATIHRCLLETTAASILPLPTQTLSSINFPKFLKQASGKIPTRSELIRILLKKCPRSPLTNFITLAEDSLSPYEIREAYLAFTESSSFTSDDLSLNSDVADYAALRILIRTSEHFNKISLDLLSKLIPFLTLEKIESLSVRIAYSKLLPIHIDMRTQTLSFEPRGAQHMITISNQLTNIYTSLQQSIPDITMNAANNNTKLYVAPDYLVNRPQQLKNRKEAILDKLQREQAARDEQMKKEQAEREEAEKQARLVENAKNAERIQRAKKFDFAMNEVIVLCGMLQIDVDSVLVGRPSESKSDSLEWIQKISEEVKKEKIRATRSEADKVQKIMDDVKEDIGKRLIRERLATKYKVMQTIENEPKILNRLMKQQVKSREKLFKAEEEIYNNLLNMVAEAKPFYDQLKVEMNALCEKERAEQMAKQPMPDAVITENAAPAPAPSAGYKKPEEVIIPRKQPAPPREEPKPEHEETQPTESKSKIWRPSFLKGDETESQPAPAAYQPPQRVQPSPAAYQPPQRVQPAPAAYQPPQRAQPSPAGVYQPPQRAQPAPAAYQPPQRAQPAPAAYQPPQRAQPSPAGAYQPPQRAQPSPAGAYQPPQRAQPSPAGAYQPPQRAQPAGRPGGGFIKRSAQPPQPPAPTRR